MNDRPDVNRDRELLSLYEPFVLLEGSESSDYWNTLVSCIYAAGSAAAYERAHTMLEWLMEDMERFFTEFMWLVTENEFTAIGLQDACEEATRRAESLTRVGEDDLRPWMRNTDDIRSEAHEAAIRRLVIDVQRHSKKYNITIDDIVGALAREA